jgi:hypothetical protein
MPKDITYTFIILYTYNVYVYVYVYIYIHAYNVYVYIYMYIHIYIYIRPLCPIQQPLSSPFPTVYLGVARIACTLGFLRCWRHWQGPCVAILG